MRSETEQDKKDKIIRAAYKCVRNYGAKRTTIEDISREAGISRRTIYNIFSSRREIFSELLFQRISYLGSKISRSLANCSVFEDALIEGSFATVNQIFSDKVYRSFYESDPTLVMMLFDEQKDSRLDDVTLTIFAETFRLGRRDGLVRSDLSDHDLADWLRSFHFLLLVHGDTTKPKIQRMIRTFFLPSVR